MVFLSQKVDENMIFTDYRKVIVLIFLEIGNTVFSWAKKVDWKMIFTDYWKGIVWNFSVIENTIFFWVKKLMERWYLLVTEKFSFWTFRWWETRSFSQPKSWWKDDITWSFGAFHDIPRLGKYGFSCSDKETGYRFFRRNMRIRLIRIHWG